MPGTPFERPLSRRSVDRVPRNRVRAPRSGRTRAGRPAQRRRCRPRGNRFGASQTYGLFGVVIGLVAWLYLAGTIIVVCAEINAVRSLELWPRSLAAPVTGTGPLTTADRQAYSAYAETEKHVKPQRIDVDFDREPADSDSDKLRGTAKGPMR